MQSWLPMMAAGLIGLLGGLFALINPTSASVATTTLAGWALIVVAGLQGWAAWTSETNGARLRAGGIAAAAAFLGLSLLLGPFGDGTLMRWLVGLLLLASGAAKANAGRAMTPDHKGGDQNRPLVYGTGAVSAVLGLTVLLGANLNFGILLGVELLASGLGLILLGMYRRRRDG